MIEARDKRGKDIKNKKRALGKRVAWKIVCALAGRGGRDECGRLFENNLVGPLQLRCREAFGLGGVFDVRLLLLSIYPGENVQ